MKRNKIKFRYFLSEFIDILEIYQPEISYLLAVVCFLIHTGQTLSFLIKFDNNSYDEPKLAFLSNIIFFMNFENFVNYFNSDAFRLVIFFSVQIVIYMLIFAIILLIILKKIWNFSLKTRKMVIFLNIFTFFTNLFLWVLMIPILSFFIGIVQCEENNAICQQLYIQLLSIIFIIINCLLALAILWANRSHSFIEKGFLRIKFSFFELLVLILKFILVLFFQIIKEKISLLIFLLVLAIQILSLLNFIVNFAISDMFLNRFYLNVLSNSIIIAFFYFLKYVDTSFEEKNLFYLLMISFVFCSKCFAKFNEKVQKILYNGEFGDIKTFTISLSNFYMFFIKKQTSVFSTFFFLGIMKHHILNCKHENCVFQQKDLLFLENMKISEQNRLLNLFVAKTFLRMLRKKETRNSADYEDILLKYGSFVTYHNLNAIHAFLELQKAFSLNKNPSFYFKATVKSLEKSLKTYIQEYDRKSKEKQLKENKEMDIASFANMHKVKKNLNKNFLVLLKEKLKFWENYRNGFATYDLLFKNVSKLNNKVLQMWDFLKKNLKNSQNSLATRIFPLKYLSILACVFMNHLNEGVKFEDEIEKLRKREANSHKDVLNSTSFFENNVLFLQVSFLNSDGVIMDSSKTQKLASFFGFSLEELKSVRNIKEFMPSIFKKNHPLFISNYINKTRSSKTQEKPKIETYASDKKGFIFPIKLYLGHCFDYLNDFVFQSAVIKLRSSSQMLLFDTKGDIHGISQSFYEFFEKELGGLPVHEFKFLNIFCLVPNISEIIEKNKGFEDKSVAKIRNKYGYFYIPSNLSEIAEIFRMKEKDEEEAKSHISYASSRSQKTERSTKKEYSKNPTTTSKNAKFLKKMLYTSALSEEYCNNLQKKYAENNLFNCDILKELLNYRESKRYKINYDLIFSSSDITATETLQYCVLILQKASINYPKTDPKSSFIELKSQSFMEQSEQDPTLIVDSEIKSGFINMPPVNIAEFREPRTPYSEEQNSQNINENENNFNNNRLFTTEPEQIFNKPPAVVEPNLNVPKNSYKVKNTFEEHNINILSSNDLEENKNNKKDEDSLVESSISNKNIGEIEKNLGKTSNEKIFDFQENSSQSSSLSSLKKSFAVFNMMSTIQRNVPSSLHFILFSRLFETIFIIVFCIYLLILSKQYIYSYYLPLEEGLLNFSNFFNSYALATTILFQTDLSKNNYSSIQSNSIYFDIFKVNMEESFNTFKTTLLNERTKSNVHQYQSYFKSANINVTDILLPIFVEMAFKGFLDKVTELLNEVKTLDFHTLDRMESEYFISNFDPFNSKINDISKIIWQEFDETNVMILESIKVVLILFIIFLFFMKFFDFYYLDQYYQHLVKIINIFLRTNHNEAFTEITITNDTIKQISDESDQFLYLNYAELLINRKIIKATEDEEINSNVKKATDYNEINKKKTSKKKKANTHVSTFKRNNMTPLSRLPRLAFSMISYILIFCFLFFNYFYLSIVNDQIVQLINISNFFQNLYTLPSGIITEKLLVIREKLFDYKFAAEINQMQRRIELYNELKRNTQDLVNTNMQIPKYTLFAMQEINQIEFSNIINGNICDVLMSSGYIIQEENYYCEKIYDGAFTKGLLSVNNVFINAININSEILDPNSAEITSKLLNFLQQESVADDIASIAFINQALRLFYSYLQDYYQNAMLKQQENLQIMMILTTIFLGGGFLIAMFWYMRYCKKLYRNITLTLSMIPYERLINDEQTVFLIKKFGKD